MANPFFDQERFMRACDQTVDKFNQQQFDMYIKLIKEETDELLDAIDNNNSLEQLDALVDILVVTVGAIHSMGADASGAWNEVMRTNFAKINSVTGKVVKREDGKVLKPTDWTPPDLEPFITKTNHYLSHP